MKKWYQSKTHWFTAIALPAFAYALANVNTLGLDPVHATYAGIALTGVVMGGNAWLRQTTDKAIG